jgi:AcrR family transcriptional regulator
VIDEDGPYSITDQVIDQISNPPRLTRAEQRDNTRRAILAATVDCLVDDGYAALTTRRIAERAGVAQSTLMHHFETRESLLVESVATLATSLAHSSLAQIDLAALSSQQGHREAVLDQVWQTFTTPEALAAAQLWGAAWNEPELAAALAELELRIAEIVITTAQTVFPDESKDPRFPIMIDGVVQLIRGLIMAIPISGRPAIDARWAAIRPVLTDAAAHLIVPPPR